MKSHDLCNLNVSFLDLEISDIAKNSNFCCPKRNVSFQKSLCFVHKIGRGDLLTSLTFF